ncbi:unnamed protein product, partial [Pelagomonas calceolata]
ISRAQKQPAPRARPDTHRRSCPRCGEAAASMADYNIPRMPKHYGTLKMPEHDVERELTLLRQNWKDLPISAVVSEYGYACHAQRLADIGTGKTPCLVDCRTPRTMKRKTFRPEVDIKRRPKSAGARRPKTPQRPATRDGRRAIESGTRDLSAETKEILRGGYTLDDKQKEVYDQFTEMLADFDLYMMVIDQCVGHFSAMTRPCWLHRAEDDATILHERAVKF